MLTKCKRVLSFFRRYGFVCIIVIAVIVFGIAAFVLRRPSDIVTRLLDMMSRERQLHNEYVQGLEDIDTHQDQATVAAIQRAEVILTEIDRQYVERGEQLDADKRAQIKEITQKYIDDPERMTREFADKMGFVYVSSN